MPTRQPRGVSTKGPSLGLMRFLSVPAGVEGGGYTPGQEIPVAGPSISGDSLPPIKTKGTFTPYKPKSGFRDFMSGGADSSLASQFNFQQGMTQAQLEADADRQRASEEAAMQRLTASNMNALELEKLRGSNSINTIGATHDANNVLGNVPWNLRTKFDTEVGPTRLQQANTLAQAQLKGMSNPKFESAVANNVLAQQQLGPMELRAKGTIDVPTNTDVYTPEVPGIAPQKFTGQSQVNTLQQFGGMPMIDKSGKPMIGPDGKPIVMGGEVKNVTSMKPGSMTTLPTEDELKQREMEERAAFEASRKQLQGRAGYDSPIGPTNVSVKGAATKQPTPHSGPVRPEEMMMLNLFNAIKKLAVKSAPGNY